MTGFRYRRGSSLALALALGSSLILDAPAPAAAASGASQARLAAAELPKAAQPAAEGSTAGKNAFDDEPGCHRARKRLWVDGEGWIVRRVTTCR